MSSQVILTSTCVFYYDLVSKNQVLSCLSSFWHRYIVASLCDSKFFFLFNWKTFLCQHGATAHITTTFQSRSGWWLASAVLIIALWTQMEQGELVNIKPGGHDWVTLYESVAGRRWLRVSQEEPALQLQTASELNKRNKGYLWTFLLTTLWQIFYADFKSSLCSYLCFASIWLDR